MGGPSDLCGVVNDSAAINITQPTGLEGWECCHHLQLTGVILLILHEGEGHQETSPSALCIFFAWLHVREGESWSYRNEEKYPQGWELEAPGRPPTLRTLSLYSGSGICTRRSGNFALIT